MYSPNIFSSSQSYGVTDLKSGKKKQTQIKTATGSFMKLLINWKQDVSQIDILLNNLQILITTVESIQRMKCRQPQPSPLFDQMFPDAYILLTGKIYGEIEAVYHQLRHYIVGLGDVVAAIRMMEREASNLVKNEKIEIFGMDGLDVIFTADHVLSIQQLCCQYLMEYERKQEIVRGVISCETSEIFKSRYGSSILNDANDSASDEINCRESSALPWVKSEDIDIILSIWADESDESYIDVEEGFYISGGRNSTSSRAVKDTRKSPWSYNRWNRTSSSLYSSRTPTMALIKLEQEIQHHHLHRRDEIDLINVPASQNEEEVHVHRSHSRTEREELNDFNDMIVGFLRSLRNLVLDPKLSDDLCLKKSVWSIIYSLSSFGYFGNEKEVMILLDDVLLYNFVHG